MNKFENFLKNTDIELRFTFTHFCTLGNDYSRSDFKVTLHNPRLLCELGWLKSQIREKEGQRMTQEEAFNEIAKMMFDLYEPDSMDVESHAEGTMYMTLKKTIYKERHKNEEE